MLSGSIPIPEPRSVTPFGVKELMAVKINYLSNSAIQSRKSRVWSPKRPIMVDDWVAHVTFGWSLYNAVKNTIKHQIVEKNWKFISHKIDYCGCNYVSPVPFIGCIRQLGDPTVFGQHWPTTIYSIAAIGLRNHTLLTHQWWLWHKES